MRTAQETRSTIPFHVVIAAAGQGVRFGGDRPKQYALLNGKPVLRHTIDIFLNHQNLASLRVIINPEHLDLYNEAVFGLDLAPPIYGSNSRNSSIYNALKSISHRKNEEIFLVHDAVRPLVTLDEIDRLIEETAKTGAAALATPVTDTIRYISGEPLSRDGLWTVQTPQGFHFGLLKKAHEVANDSNATDDTTLVAALGHKISYVEGSRGNIKITVPEDLILAEKLLAKNYDVRTGMGFDVHAFEKNDPSRALILCGVKVDHKYGLAGHSDADVALHALTDAILGAIAEGDVGHHFPPSDNTFKDMSSDVFLKHVKTLADQKGAIIQNVDVTIICEEPKIGPYRDAMKKNVAKVLNITPSKVGIKATTTEQLGFTGRREGIAAQAIATLKIPEGE